MSALTLPVQLAKRIRLLQPHASRLARLLLLLPQVHGPSGAYNRLGAPAYTFQGRLQLSKWCSWLMQPLPPLWLHGSMRPCASRSLTPRRPWYLRRGPRAVSPGMCRVPGLMLCVAVGARLCVALSQPVVLMAAVSHPPPPLLPPLPACGQPELLAQSDGALSHASGAVHYSADSPSWTRSRRPSGSQAWLALAHASFAALPMPPS